LYSLQYHVAAVTVSDTGISCAGSIDEKSSGPRQKTRKSLETGSKKATGTRSRKALDTLSRKSEGPRRDSSKRTVDKQASMHNFQNDIIEENDNKEEEVEEEGVSGLSYGFWNTREQDMRKFKKSAAAVRVDPRVLQPLHQQQVDKMFETLGEHGAGDSEGTGDMDVSGRELLPPKPMVLHRRGSVVSNLMAMGPEAFSSGLQTTRNGYANPAIFDSAYVPQKDCPEGFGRLSALFGGAKDSLAALGAKRLTKSHHAPDLRGMFTKLPSIMRK
jgi:hypothetical protein